MNNLKKIYFLLFVLCYPLLSLKNANNGAQDWIYEYQPNKAVQTSPGQIAPLGKIHFYKKIPIKDATYRSIHNKDWTPSIHYEVYDITQLDSVKVLSRYVQIFSSCVEPEVGGEYILSKRYIFFNNNVCTNCYNNNNKVNRCDPAILLLKSTCKKYGTLQLDNFLNKLGIQRKK